MHVSHQSRVALVLLCLVFTAAVPRSQTVPVDLNGTWTIPDGTVIVVISQGARGEGRVRVPSQQLVETWGWTSGERYLEGVVTAGDFFGQAVPPFPPGFQ